MKNMHTKIHSLSCAMLCTMLILSSQANAQKTTYGWTNQTGGATNDESRSVAIDAAGNVLTAGNFTGTVDFDPGVGSLYMTASGETDFYIQKVSPTGVLIWAKSFGGSEADFVNGIATDADGSLFLTGGFTGIADFDPSVAIYNLTSMPWYAADNVTQLTNKSDAFILKLDANGNFIWVKQLGGSGPDYGVAIAIDNNGKILTTGNCSDLRNYNDTIDVDPGPGVYNLIKTGSYALKLSSSGNFVWAKGYGKVNGGASIGGIGWYTKSYTFIATGITTDLNSNKVYVTGNFSGTVDFDEDGSSYNMSALGGNSAGANNFDLAIIALKGNGDFRWAKQVGGQSSTASANAITTDGLGHVVSAGTFSGIIDFDPGISANTISSFVASGTPSTSKPSDAFVLKLDSSGEFIWAKQIGGNKEDAINGIAIAGNNSIYATGSFTKKCDFNPSPTSAKNLTSLGGIDAYVLKLDVAGDYQWVKQMGGTDDDQGNSIALTGGTKTDVYTAGYFKTTVDFDPTNGVASIVSVGVSDAFVQKLTENSQFNKTENETPNDLSAKAKEPYIYPNPAQNELHVELGQQLENGILSIVNLSGATISQREVQNQGTITLDITNLPSGAYLIMISSNDTNTVGKFMKN